MAQYINIKVKPKTAALLLISGELDLFESNPLEDADKILNELNSLKIDELLEIVDNHTKKHSIPVGDCPQFGKLSILIDVPEKILENGYCSYAQLGVLLKGHSNDSYVARRKFGEYYGKTAALLGLICLRTNENDCGFTSSFLTAPFCKVEYKTQLILIQKLSFRVTIIQALLRKARTERVNGYDFFKDGTMSTRIKKMEGINHLLKNMRELNDEDLGKRLNNIYWEESTCN